MKRYWKLIILSAVILCTFTIYYLQPIIAKDELFELELVTVQDTDDMGEDITIIGDIYESEDANGDYYNSTNYRRFELNSEEMIYQHQLSYFQRLNQVHHISKMKQLIKDYRSFMRGKQSIELLYEDEESLAYVGPYGQNPENGIVQLDISILNKISNEEQNFRVEITLQGPMHFVNITDVQLLHNKLYILANQYGPIEEALYIYQIDVAERTLDNFTKLNDVIDGDFWKVNDYYRIGKETHYVFRKQEAVQDEETYEDTFVSYHIETGETNEIEAPNDWGVYEDITESEVNTHTLGNFVIKEEFMYFIRFTEESMVIDKYNLLENTLESTNELVLEAETIAGLNLVYSEGDKVSLISTNSTQGSKDRSINVIDLLKGEVIYEGEINIANTSKELHVYDIEFYQIHLN